MKEHPILFSTEMVQALLEGRKTATRRIVKQQPLESIGKIGDDYGVDIDGCMGKKVTYASFEGEFQFHSAPFPYGHKGDQLWVKESFLELTKHAGQRRFLYKAETPSKYGEKPKWKPSIHMPKVASRLCLEITDIRVERLNSISMEDAICEGVHREWDGIHHWFKNYSKKAQPSMFKNPIDSYISLWEQINGIDSWKRDPWVWVIEFKKTEK